LLVLLSAFADRRNHIQYEDGGIYIGVSKREEKNEKLGLSKHRTSVWRGFLLATRNERCDHNVYQK
jgi:hypothetical protein